MRYRIPFLATAFFIAVSIFGQTPYEDVCTELMTYVEQGIIDGYQLKIEAFGRTIYAKYYATIPIDADSEQAASALDVLRNAIAHYPELNSLEPKVYRTAYFTRELENPVEPFFWIRDSCFSDVGSGDPYLFDLAYERGKWSIISEEYGEPSTDYPPWRTATSAGYLGFHVDRFSDEEIEEALSHFEIRHGLKWNHRGNSR